MHFLQLIALIGTLGPIAAQLELPDPRIVIVGPTGSGKSSLANALLGCDPRSNDCMFEVCPDLDSCTKETSIGTGPWLGTEQNFTVVDTPGFGDSDGEDNKLIEEMMEVLDDSLGYSNTILLLFDGQTARFTTGLHNMLRQMSSLFGATWWDFMVIGVSKWKYSQEAIDDREENCNWYPESCKDEAWFMREINGQLQEKFHLDRNFSFAFIDSYSQSKPELDDQVQQEHYQAEAKILWDSATTRNSTFDFKTIDDVLEENVRQKEEIKWLNDVITNNISQLMEITSSNTEAIEAANIRIADNIEADNDLKGVVNHVIENVANVDGKVVINEIHIEEITKNIEDTNLPVGSIIAWSGRSWTSGATFPKGWQSCDGSYINEGPMAGKSTPNLNGEGRFLRGGVKDLMTLQNDQVHEHNHTIIVGVSIHDSGHIHKDKGHSHVYTDLYAKKELSDNADDRWVGSDDMQSHDRYTTTGFADIQSSKTGITATGTAKSTGVTDAPTGTETRPKNMVVQWIMKIYET